MTPERSRHMNAKIENARTTAQATGQGIEVTTYDCGGYSYRATTNLLPGDKVFWARPCTTGHPGHDAQGVSDEVLDAFANTKPTRPDTTADVACLISAAADVYRGLPTNNPTTQDRAAAESITAAYYLIPRTELPTVNPNAITASAPTVGTYTFSGKHDRDLTKIRKDLTSLAAWVDYLERTQAAAAQAAEETQHRRRQAVLAELLPESPAAARNWDSLSHLSRRAVERIIALEDGQR